VAGGTHFFRKGFPPSPLPERLQRFFPGDTFTVPMGLQSEAVKNLSKSWEEGSGEEPFFRKVLPRETALT
jgi:hypothetical protein